MNTASTSSADSTKGVDLADFPFLNKYLKSVEDFPGEKINQKLRNFI